jgi:preprotein translocase subunit SecG
LSVLVNILLVVNVFVCVALIAVVLIQRSEGGALGMGGGGGPSGFLTTRGAGDLLTRLTWILAGVFFVISVAQTLLIGHAKGSGSLVDRLNVQSLDLSQPPAASSQPPAQSSGPGLQAPTPTVQTPASGAAPPQLTAPAPTNAKPPADPLAILATPAPSAPKKP